MVLARGFKNGAFALIGFLLFTAWSDWEEHPLLLNKIMASSLQSPPVPEVHPRNRKYIAQAIGL
jgi:hypothetical protein